MQKGRGEVSLTWPLGRLWERERVSGVRWEGEWEMRWKMWNLQLLKKCPKFKYFGMTRKFYQKSRIRF